MKKTYYIKGKELAEKVHAKLVNSVEFRVRTVEGEIETYKNKFRLLYGRELENIEIEVIGDKPLESKLVVTCLSNDDKIHVKGKLWVMDDYEICGLFSHMVFLENIDISKLDTKDVTDIRNMFDGCTGLSRVDLSNLNTENVVDMSYMFKECLCLEKVDLSNFKTDKLKNTIEMFYKCMSLRDVNLSTFDLAKLNTLGNRQHMFLGCGRIETLHIPEFDKQLVEAKKNGLFVK